MSSRSTVVGGAGRRGNGVPANDSPKFWTIKAVAELLEVSQRTVRRWIATGELLAHRIGALVRIADADLHAFLVRHRQ